MLRPFCKQLRHIELYLDMWAAKPKRETEFDVVVPMGICLKKCLKKAEMRETMGL